MRLEELRSTLADHAYALDDQPRARIAPVHRRIAAARRRRAAALAGAVAAVVVAVALGVVPLLVVDRDLAPAGGDAPGRLAGREVPRTEVATGLTYRYVRGYQSSPGARSLDVAVPVGDRPRLVMWASSDTDRRPVVRLADRLDPEATQVSGAGGFDRYTVVYPYGDGRSHVQRLRLSERGAGDRTRLGIAVYDLTDLARAGVTDGTVVFRRHMAGADLVKAVLGRPGEADLRFSLRVPAAGLAWSSSCYHSTRWFSVSVDGRPLLGSQCRRQPDLDPGATAGTFDRSPLPAGVRPGDSVEVRVHLSPDSRDTTSVARDPRAVLGLGVYAVAGPRHVVLGHELPDRTEADGHDWVASRWESAPAGAGSLRVHLAAADRPRLVTWAAVGVAGRTHRIQLAVAPVAGGAARTVDEAAGAVAGFSSGSGYVVQPGQSPDVVLRVPSGGGDGTRLALVLSDLLH